MIVDILTVIVRGCKQKTIAERIMLKTKAKLSLITGKCGEKRNTWTSFLIRDLCPFLGFRCSFKLNIIFCTCSFAFYDHRYPAVIVRGCKPVALILFQKPNGAKKKNNIREDHVENESKIIIDHEKMRGEEKHLNIFFDSRFYFPSVPTILSYLVVKWDCN